jgi:hypothetical protein
MQWRKCARKYAMRELNLRLCVILFILRCTNNSSTIVITNVLYTLIEEGTNSDSVYSYVSRSKFTEKGK